MVPWSASHSRAANSTSVCSTVCRSKAERLMTLSTSAVAVCCRSRFAQLVEQPGVLDRDHRLIGKGGHQLDLVVGERLDLRLPQRNRAQRGALAQHGHDKRGPILTELLRLPQRSFRRVIFGIGQHVGDVHCATFNDGPACRCPSVRQDRVFRPQFLETGDVVESGDRASAGAVEAENQPVRRAAQPRRRTRSTYRARPADRRSSG